MFKKSYKTELIHDIRDFEKRTVIDVRELDEFHSGHIPHALNLPLSDLANQTHTLNPDVEYTLICHSGARSAQAAKFLSKHGFKVINVMGGMGNYRGVLVR